MRSIYDYDNRPFSALVIIALAAFMIWPAFAQQGAMPAAHNPLAELLLTKGILSPDEVKLIDQSATPQQANEHMARILLDKGVISKADYEQIVGTASSAAPLNATHVAPVEQVRAEVQIRNQPQSTNKTPATGLSASISAQAPPNPTEPGAPSMIEKYPVKTVISALTPIRALPAGGISRDATVPAFKIGGVGITPYGFIKVTAVEDSSSPNGDDFPLPGFLSDTGPNGAPEFHIKARSTRFGANFAWYDPSPKWSITGKIEMDFEGNFNRSDNRNISTVRSSNPSLRLAWGRLDYKANNKNTIFALFGQDWSPFGSSTLPNRKACSRSRSP